MWVFCWLIWTNSGGGQWLPRSYKCPTWWRLSTPDFPGNSSIVETSRWKFCQEKGKDPDASKKNDRNFYFCVAYSRFLFTSIHRVIGNQNKTFNLSWMRVKFSYHNFIIYLNCLKETSLQKLGEESSPVT